MSMHNLNLLANDDVSEYRKEGKDCRERRLAINDEEGHMIDFETVGKISYSTTTFVCMRYDDDLVPTVDEFLRTCHQSVEFSQRFM